MTAHRTLATLALLGGIVALPACGSGDPATPGTDAARSDAVIARVVTAGGYTSRADQFSIVPEVVIYADGRVIKPSSAGPALDYARRPLLPALEVRRLDAEGLGRMRDAIERSGLLAAGEVDYGVPNVTDTPTTSVTLSVDGRTASHAANALREVPRFRITGLTKAQIAARERLAALIHDLRSAGTVAGEGHISPAETYIPESLMVESYAAPEEIAASVDWPLASIPLSPTETCREVAGADAGTLRERLSSAFVSTVFIQGSGRYTTSVRPVLPGEPGCPEPLPASTTG